MKLYEGGNVFKNDSGSLTYRISTKDVEPTVNFLEKITGLDFTAEKGEDKKPVKWLGTTGRKEHPDGTFELNSSGDLDLSVDSNEISKDELIEKLVAWLTDQGVEAGSMFNVGRKKNDGWIKDAGDQVHFRTPINGDLKNGFVQTDFMFSAFPEFQRGSMIGGSDKYRGEHRHILLSSIARARGLKYSPKFGLVDPDTNDVISNDWNTIAKKLLGQTATVADIRSVEKIIDYIKKLLNYEDLIAAARETLGKYGVELPSNESLETFKEGSRDWFRKIMNTVSDKSKPKEFNNPLKVGQYVKNAFGRVGRVYSIKSDDQVEVHWNIGTYSVVGNHELTVLEK